MNYQNAIAQGPIFETQLIEVSRDLPQLVHDLLRSHLFALIQDLLLNHLLEAGQRTLILLLLSLFLLKSSVANLFDYPNESLHVDLALLFKLLLVFNKLHIEVVLEDEVID